MTVHSWRAWGAAFFRFRKKSKSPTAVPLLHRDDQTHALGSGRSNIGPELVVVFDDVPERVVLFGVTVPDAWVDVLPASLPG
jgi:hypothetical protein